MHHIQTTILKAKIIKQALDLFSRLSIGQLHEVDHFASIGRTKIAKINSDGKFDFVMANADQCMQLRTWVDSMRYALGYLHGQSLGISHPHGHVDGKRAYEVFCVMSQALAFYDNPNPRFRGVSYDGLVLRYTSDPAPIVTILSSLDDGGAGRDDDNSEIVTMTINDEQLHVIERAMDTYHEITQGRVSHIAELVSEGFVRAVHDVNQSSYHSTSQSSHHASDAQVKAIEIYTRECESILGYPLITNLGHLDALSSIDEQSALINEIRGKLTEQHESSNHEPMH